MKALNTFLAFAALVPLPFLRSASAVSSSAAQGSEGKEHDLFSDVQPHSVSVSDSGALQRSRHVEKVDRGPSLVRKDSRARHADTPKLNEETRRAGTLKLAEVVEHSKNEVEEEELELPHLTSHPPHQRQRHVLQDDPFEESDLAELDDDVQFDIMRNSLDKKGGILKKVFHRKHVPRPIPCTFLNWGGWGGCSKTCASGTKKRYRSKKGPYHGGRACPAHPTVSVVKCNTRYCPIDCKWNAWGGFGGCSKTCNSGTHKRYRSKNGPYHGGRACPAHPAVNVARCNTHYCPIDCKWNAWGAFSACSKSCGMAWDGMGSYTRLRGTHGPFHGGTGCGGPKSHTTNCNKFECPVNCLWTQWEKWTACPVSCGGGEHIRKRTQAPEVAYGGAACLGVLNMKQACKALTCPINCVWAGWTEWGECSSSCGNEGFMNAKRLFLIHPKHGGAVCDGNHSRATQCNVLDCPVDCLWSEWGAWSNCSNPCGGGMHEALRVHKSHARFGGQPCNGTDLKAEACNNHTCPSLEIKGGSNSMHQVPLLILMAVLLADAAK